MIYFFLFFTIFLAIAFEFDIICFLVIIFIILFISFLVIVFIFLFFSFFVDFYRFFCSLLRNYLIFFWFTTWTWIYFTWFNF